MNSKTLYMLFTLFGATLASDFDSDSDGIRVTLMGDLDGNQTDKEMRDFNKGLDNAVDVVNERYKQALKTEAPRLIAEIDAKPKPSKLTDAKWAEIKEQMKAKVNEKLYRKISYDLFKDYGNFVTRKGSEENDTMFQFGGKNIFDHPDYTLDDIDLKVDI